MTTGDGIQKALAEGRILLGKKIEIPSLFAGDGDAEDQPKTQTLVLPYPPSMNTYWLSTILGKGPKAFISVFISPAGKLFKKTAREKFAEQGGLTMKGPLSVAISFCPPDKRDRDWDNPIKPLMDALQRDEKEGFSGAYLNDSQIKHAEVWMRGPVRGGLTTITISQIG